MSTIIGNLITLDGQFADWPADDSITKPGNIVAGYQVYGALINDTSLGHTYVVGIDATVATDPVIAANTFIYLNTDQDTATGYTPFGHVGAEYYVQFATDLSGILQPYLYSVTSAGVATQLNGGAPLNFGFSSNGESTELTIPQTLLTPAGGVAPESINLAALINNGAVALPGDFNNNPQYTIVDPSVPVLPPYTVGKLITLDGQFTDWPAADSLMKSVNTVAGYQLYGAFLNDASLGGDTYVIGIDATVSTDPVIDANTFVYLNTDRNASTGYSPFGSIGAEYYVRFSLDSHSVLQPYLYSVTSAGVTTLLNGGAPLHFGVSSNGESTELAIPKALLTPAGGVAPGTIDFAVLVGNGAAALPGDFANNPQYTIFTGAPNRAPVVTTMDQTATHNQIFAATGLFTVSDADNDPIVAYQFWDSIGNAAGGHWVVGGAVQGTGQAIDVTPAQLASATFQSGSGSDHLWVRANDGTTWGAWQDLHVNAPLDHAPVVTVMDQIATHNQIFAATGLFTVSDSDNDPIVAYQFWDSVGNAAGGHWVVGGAVQGTGQAIDVTPAQLASATFQSGSGSDHLWVRANDGTTWGAWQDLHVNAPLDHAPVVTAMDQTATHNQIFAATGLFTVSDADNDPIVAYQFWDSIGNAAGGHWVVGGAVQGTGQAIDVTPAQLASATFQSGSSSDHLWVRANDGTAWGAWQDFHVNAPLDHAPVVSGSDTGLALNTSAVASSLFSATDADQDPIKQYELWDSSNAGSSGRFIVGSTAQATGQGIFLDTLQYSQTSFMASSTPATDRLWERAYDGNRWSDWVGINVTSHV